MRLSVKLSLKFNASELKAQSAKLKACACEIAKCSIFIDVAGITFCTEAENQAAVSFLLSALSFPLAIPTTDNGTQG